MEVRLRSVLIVEVKGGLSRHLTGVFGAFMCLKRGKTVRKRLSRSGC